MNEGRYYPEPIPLLSYIEYIFGSIYFHHFFPSNVEKFIYLLLPGLPNTPNE